MYPNCLDIKIEPQITKYYREHLPFPYPTVPHTNHSYLIQFVLHILTLLSATGFTLFQ